MYISMMVRLIVMACLIATAVVALSSITTAQNTNTYVFVTNFWSKSFTVIDARTDAVVTTVSVPDYVDNIALSSGGTELYAVGFGQGTRTLYAYSTADFRLKYTIALNSTAYIYCQIVLSQDGKKAYVSASQGSYDDFIQVIDLPSRTLGPVIPLINSSSPRLMDISPDGRYIAVVQNNQPPSNSRRCYVIDTTTNSILSSWPYDGAGYIYSITMSNSHVFVMESDNNSVTRWTFAGVKDKAVPMTNGYCIDYGDNGYLYASNNTQMNTFTNPDGGFSYPPWKNVSIYNLTGNYPGSYYIKYSQFYDKVYFRVDNNNTIGVLDRLTDTVTNYIPVGGGTQYSNIVVGEIASEALVPIQHPVTITVHSMFNMKYYKDVEISIYETDTGKFKFSKMTDSTGSVVFVLYPEVRYTAIASKPSDNINRTQEIYGIRTEYGFDLGFRLEWNEFSWVDHGSVGEYGNGTKEQDIYTTFDAIRAGNNGYFDVTYVDYSRGTTWVNFTIWMRDPSDSRRIVLVAAEETTGTGISGWNHNFSISSVSGKDFIVGYNSTNTFYGAIKGGKGYHWPGAKWSLGPLVPNEVYIWLSAFFVCFIFMGAGTIMNKGFAGLAGCLMGWVLWEFAGWMDDLGWMGPVLLTFATLASLVMIWSQKNRHEI